MSRFAAMTPRKAPNSVIKELNASKHYFAADEIGNWKLAAMDDEAYLKMARKWDVPQVSPPVSDIPYLLSYMEIINMGIYHKVLPYTFRQVEDFIQRPKSPGYPWTQMGYRTKGDVLDCPKFRGWFSRNNAARYSFMYSLFPKEELRPVEKVAMKSTRAIMNAPIDFLLRYGRFVYPVLNQLLNAPLRGPSTLGVCPFYGGWHYVAKKILTHFFGMEADIEANDMSQNYTIMLVEHLFSKQYLALTEADDREYDHLFHCSVFKFVVLMDGTVIMIPFGRATGEVKTALGNTDNCMIIVFWAISYMIQDFVGIPRDSRNCLKFFIDNFTFIVNGDDNNITCSHEVVHWFTCDNFIPYAKRLGFTFSFSSPVHLLPTSMRFLGLGFEVYNGMYIPAPDKSKVLAAVFNSGRIRERSEPWIAFQRLCALRVLLFPYPSEFERISQLLHDFSSKYEPIFAGTKEWQDAKSSYFSKYEIIQLYCGFESRCLEKIGSTLKSNANLFPQLEWLVKAVKTINPKINLKTSPRALKL